MSYARDFTIGLREVQSFHLYLALRRWWKGILGFSLVTILVVWMYMFRLAPDSPPAAVAIVAVVFALMVAGVGTLSTAAATIIQVRRKVRQSGRESYVQSTRIDGYGIHVTVGKKKAKLPFDRLLRVCETRGAFYLFLAENQAWILPKAQMEDREAECAQLRRIFETVVERRKLRLRKRS